MIAGDGNGARKWITLSSRKVYECNVFSVFEQQSQGPDGRIGHFSVMEAKDWAVIVPYVQTGQDTSFLMVRQYRHGADVVSLEFPGGVIEPGEEPAHAAVRELAERQGGCRSAYSTRAQCFPNPQFRTTIFIFLSRLVRNPKSIGISTQMRLSMHTLFLRTRCAVAWEKVSFSTRSWSPPFTSRTGSSHRSSRGSD